MADFRTYRDRYLESHIKRAMGDTRLVALVGPRQAGKSTLARHLSGGAGGYFSFDDIATLAAAEADPVAFAGSLPVGSVLDEVQRLPQVLLAVKSIVDRDGRPGRFLLTGSANILTLPTLADSLAGRIEIFTLLPFSQAEIQGSRDNFIDALFGERAPSAPAFGSDDDAMTDWLDRILAGGFPEVLERSSDSRRNAWFRSYVTTIVQRDIRDVSRISDTLGMDRVLRLCAARSSSILNETSVASEIELPRKTVSRYIDLLEQMFLVWRLPAYARERGRRVTRSPKVHLVDVGLAAYLYGADFHLLSHHRTKMGPLLETLVLTELRAQAGWSAAQPSLYHYREYDGLEIDAVLERRNGDIAAVEVKATSSPSERDFAPLRKFAALMGDAFQCGILLYGGSKPLAFGEKLRALPVSALWSQRF